MAQQTQVVIGGYTFHVNPKSISKPQPVSYTANTTLGGGFISTFYDPTNGVPGIFVFDQIHTLEWPVLNTAQYTQLETLKNEGIIQTYTDPQGDNFHMFMQELTHTSINPGGLDAFIGVKLTLRMISQP